MDRSYQIIQSAIRVGISILALVALFAPAAATATPRLEIIDGNLWDHASGLVWQPLASTRGMPLPTDAIVGDWRVATGNALFFRMGHPFDETIARDSDRLFALEFFAAGSPCDAVEYEGCFGGWWHDAPGQPGNPAFYNVGGYRWTAIAGDPAHVLVSSGFSLGSDTEDRCGIFCRPDDSLYTVRPIPEPGTGVLLISGLVLARGCLSRRARGASSMQ